MDQVLSAALAYQRKGLSVIPVREDKRPYIRWERYQNEKAGADEIRTWFKQWPGAGVGIVTGAISGLDVLDIDSSEGEEKLIEALGEGLVSFNPPLAKTPRGGKHLYIQSTGEGNRIGFLSHVDFRGQGGYIVAPPSPGPNGKGYAWKPGASIFDLPLPALPASLLSIIKNSISYMGGVVNPRTDDHKRPHLTTSDHINFTEGNRDNTLFHLANHLVKGGMPPQEIQVVLSLIASKLCNPPFPENEIPAKVQSALKRVETRERNISQEVRDWALTTSDHWMTTDCHTWLHLTTREEQKVANMVILRMAKEGLIEKHGDRRGCYRTVDTQCEAIDWQAADDSPAPLEWPFGIERLALLHPKNIAVIAGVQNAGKTAIALNLAWLNKDRFKIRYLSSEMGATELKGRLKKFSVPLSEWKGIDFKERSSNFSDAIDPDALNILDYLEIADAFWKIAEDMRRIYEKLRKGVAVVCLQKTAGKDAGRGGDFGLEKPRLYLNLDPDPPDGAVLSIRKAKAWAFPGRNPNGKKVNFKIVDGCRLIKIGEWK